VSIKSVVLAKFAGRVVGILGLVYKVQNLGSVMCCYCRHAELFSGKLFLFAHPVEREVMQMSELATKRQRML